MSRWFRHYAGMMRDEKLVRVAIKSKQPVERVLWIWGAVLESAAEIDDNGRYDVDPAEVAYFLRADEDDVGAVLSGLADAGRVADGAVVNWGDRQFSSDRSKERQAAYRERKRAEKRRSDCGDKKSDDGVTSPDRHDDGDVTPQETETDNSEAIASGDAAPTPTAAQLTKSMWDAGKAILKAAGHDDRQAGSIIGRFRKTYSDSQMLTVLSRCQVEQPSEPVEWMTKALQAERNKANGQPNGRPRDRGPDPILDALARATAEAEALERASADPAGDFGTGHALPAQRFGGH